MQRFFIDTANGRLSWLKGGTGGKVLLCLHGFGETASSFSFLEEHIGNEYTMYAPDFPWHGATEWQADLPFQPVDLIDVLQQMIPNFSQQPLHLLGYSMGGRVALSLLELIPLQIEQVVLLAPDGLRLNFWYWLATQTRAGNRLFRFTMRHSGWFASMVNLLRRIGWVNPSVARFVHLYIDDQKIRTNLYHIWTTMRRFKPRLQHLQQQINQHQIPVQLLFGAYDRIIPAALGKRLKQDAPAWVSCTELKAGHQLLRPQHTAAILTCLLPSTTPNTNK